MNEIIRIWETNLIDIDNLIRLVANNHTLTSYMNLTPGWILPILNSESHRDLLLQIDSQPIEPDLSTFHYILNKLICKKVVSD
ncbi:MAG: hypothetical protein K2L64_01885, partial [Ureaplasma sp.]|nr:hypothetical protein [Ureaplasma sp.]